MEHSIEIASMEIGKMVADMMIKALGRILFERFRNMLLDDREEGHSIWIVPIGESRISLEIRYVRPYDICIVSCPKSLGEDFIIIYLFILATVLKLSAR